MNSADKLSFEDYCDKYWVVSEEAIQEMESYHRLDIKVELSRLLQEQYMLYLAS